MLVSNKAVFENIIPKSTTNTGFVGVIKLILGVVLPCILICVLLIKAKNYAKKGAGEIGGMVMTAAKMGGGLALGAAAGGAAVLGTRVIGGGGGWAANKLASRAEKMGLDRIGGRLRDVGDFARKSNFDVRGIKVAGQSLGSATGMKVGEARKGSWNETKKQQVEKRQKRADELEKRSTATQKKAVDDAEIKLKEATLPVKLDIENADRKIEKARKDLSDAKLADDGHGSNAAEIAKAKADLDGAKNAKEMVRTYAGLPGLEKSVHQAKQDLVVKSDEITTAYATTISGGLSKTLNFVFRGGYSLAGADEAARKIKTGTKLDSGEKPK